MIKKRYVKRIYFEEVYCDKCGAIMRYGNNLKKGYHFECTNEDCDGEVFLLRKKMPGMLIYEYEEDLDV